MSGRDANQLAADDLRQRIDDLIARAPQTRASGWAAEALPLMFEASAAVGLVGTLHVRAEAAEAALAEMTAWRDEAEGLYRATAEHLRHSQAALATTRQALAWYADRRNYVPAAPPAVMSPVHLMATDAWDDKGPGARARRALAATDSDTA